MIETSRVNSILERNYIKKLLKKGARIDGRGLMDYREFRITTSIVPKAEGSADVYLGDTKVIAGVKYDIGAPFGDNPEDGVCTVMSEFIPMAHPDFENGPPNEYSIQLARVVDRGIRHTNFIDLKKLCIIKGKSCYILFVDIYIADYLGNLVDASNVAAVAAIVSALLPVGIPDEKGEKAVWDKPKFMQIPVIEFPIAISFGKLEEFIFIDPSIKEEMVMDGAISFAVDGKNNITSIQKFGNATWTLEELERCTKIAIEKANELRQKLNFNQYKREPEEFSKKFMEAHPELELPSDAEVVSGSIIDEDKLL